MNAVIYVQTKGLSRLNGNIFILPLGCLLLVSMSFVLVYGLSLLLCSFELEKKLLRLERMSSKAEMEMIDNYAGFFSKTDENILN